MDDAAEVVLGAAGDLAKKKLPGASLLERIEKSQENHCRMVGHIILEIFINILNLHTNYEQYDTLYSGYMVGKNLIARLNMR